MRMHIHIQERTDRKIFTGEIYFRGPFSRGSGGPAGSKGRAPGRVRGQSLRKIFNDASKKWYKFMFKIRSL